ncbi:MAG: leucyl aminopeptidase [Acidobacteriaceae bacterium]
MKTELKFAGTSAITTEILAVMAVDRSTSKEKNAKAEPALLTSDAAVLRAAEVVLQSGEFKAASCETLLLHAPQGLQAKRLLLVGLGKTAKASVPEVRKAAGTAVRFAKPRGLREVAIALPEDAALPLAACARAAVEGAYVGDFDPDIYRSDRKDQSMQSVTVVAPATASKAEVETAFREGGIIGAAQEFTRSLVNEPSNTLTPTEMGKRAAAMCKQYGLDCSVHSTEKIKELKMGAFWSVAQGSNEPPALIVMRYEPKDAPKDGPVLGLVGKGITFDTGGISIKPSEGMEKMKYDMAGGAAMIGAMQAIAQLGPKVKVIGIVCAAENMPGGKAQKPGDVQVAMSGKTIEVLNTDAEGRLVLADGLAYAKQLGATHLMDAATLTGACVVALGMVNAGVFSNDEEAYQHFQKALEISGERFWRLPVEDEYRELIVSPIADIINTGGRWGGAITAAMFLKEFAEETPWVHLDIAGVAWMEEQKPWIAKGPSGVAVRSILEWVRSYAG